MTLSPEIVELNAAKDRFIAERDRVIARLERENGEKDRRIVELKAVIGELRR